MFKYLLLQGKTSTVEILEGIDKVNESGLFAAGQTFISQTPFDWIVVGVFFFFNR